MAPFDQSAESRRAAGLPERKKIAGPCVPDGLRRLLDAQNANGHWSAQFRHASARANPGLLISVRKREKEPGPGQTRL
ncbi:hypothetical protein PGT21_034964 [Puccinia graminis f. sp. tritici]|uniref:Uncharacterized protein n=1 Tax=Puccinia graminis f. sp. tritici TaxID=56615 RepID=A0A5B0NSB4_PUCGR|nr:hypothetical protein PGT21_034964 [Puccinia graminis f. sp. tritici]